MKTAKEWEDELEKGLVVDRSIQNAEQIIQQAMDEAAEDMRERCAKFIENNVVCLTTNGGGVVQKQPLNKDLTRSLLSYAIRNLPTRKDVK